MVQVSIVQTDGQARGHHSSAIKVIRSSGFTITPPPPTPSQQPPPPPSVYSIPNLPICDSIPCYKYILDNGGMGPGLVDSSGGLSVPSMPGLRGGAESETVMEAEENGVLCEIVGTQVFPWSSFIHFTLTLDRIHRWREGLILSAPVESSVRQVRVTH